MRRFGVPCQAVLSSGAKQTSNALHLQEQDLSVGFRHVLVSCACLNCTLSHRFAPITLEYIGSPAALPRRKWCINMISWRDEWPCLDEWYESRQHPYRTCQRSR